MEIENFNECIDLMSNVISVKEKHCIILQLYLNKSSCNSDFD